MIDLHSHTTASDGELAPAEQLALAASKGITVLAVTDHDTVAGLGAAHEAARRLGVRLVPGLEVSTRLNGRDVHVLGHFVDPAHGELSAFEARLRQEREARMAQMVEKVRALGFPVTLEMVRELADGATLTRPHLARVLVELGYVTSPREAFSRWLGDGRAAYVPHRELAPADAIALIHRAGGTATLAHPGLSRIDPLELETMARDGLDGLEVMHSEQPPSQREKLAALAEKLGLVATAGSDYHGPTVSPDRSFGQVQMPEEALVRLEARRR